MSKPAMSYRVKVGFKDSTVSLIAIFWNESCCGHFGKSADELARQSNEDERISNLPKEILACQGKSYLVEVLGYQGSESGRVYNISMLCSDPDVVNENKLAHNDSSSNVVALTKKFTISFFFFLATLN